MLSIRHCSHLYLSNLVKYAYYYPHFKDDETEAQGVIAQGYQLSDEARM